MSHFSVLVVGENVENQLAPFQENNMGDCPAKYLEFVDKEDEYQKEYESGSVEMFRTPNGLKYRWDDSVKNDLMGEYPKETVMHKDQFSSFEAFMKEWHGSKQRDPGKQRYGYWENPNAKWDWWTVGGRWSGKLALKSGGEADSAKKGDVNTSELHTFAVLWDGKWCQEGEMGWFACVHNENPNWQEDCKSIIESIPEDATVTIVDCHI